MAKAWHAGYHRARGMRGHSSTQQHGHRHGMAVEAWTWHVMAWAWHQQHGHRMHEACMPRVHMLQPDSKWPGVGMAHPLGMMASLNHTGHVSERSQHPPAAALAAGSAAAPAVPWGAWRKQDVTCVCLSRGTLSFVHAGTSAYTRHVEQRASCKLGSYAAHRHPAGKPCSSPHAHPAGHVSCLPCHAMPLPPGGLPAAAAGRRGESPARTAFAHPAPSAPPAATQRQCRVTHACLARQSIHAEWAVRCTI